MMITPRAKMIRMMMIRMIVIKVSKKPMLCNLFNNDVLEFTPKERLEITNRLRREMIEIYTGMNIYE